MFNRKKDKQQTTGSKKAVISAALKKNIDMLDGLFSNDETFKMRCFENRADGSVKCCIFFIDGMVDGALLSDCVITPVMTLDFGEDKVDIDDLKTRFITADEVRNTKSLTELAVAIQKRGYRPADGREPGRADHLVKGLEKPPNHRTRKSRRSSGGRGRGLTNRSSRTFPCCAET